MSDVETHNIGEKRLIVFRTNYIEFLGEAKMREMGWQRCPSQGEHSNAHGCDQWTIALDRYERDNLLSIFALGGSLVSGISVPPFTMLNSGDWFGQIPQKLVSEQE